MEITPGLKKYITENLLPFRTLPEPALNSLLAAIETEVQPAQHVLFQCGDKEGDVYYLLAGKVRLETEEGQATFLEPGMDEAAYPLSNMLPRRYTVTVTQPAQFLRFDRTVFQEATGAEGGKTDDGGAADDLSEAEDLDWMTSLLQSQIFTKIPMERIPQIFSLFEEVGTEKGETIIRQGDTGDYYFIIKEGVYHVLRKGKNKKEFLLAQLREGDGFGEEALIGNIPRNASVVSEAEGKLLRISKKHFLSLIRDPTIEMLSFAEAMNRVKQGANLIDVRFPEEFQSVALPGSRNCPLDTLRIEMKKMEPQGQYIVCCDNGTRSSIAAFLLLEHGFNVNCIQDGIGGHLGPGAGRPAKGTKKRDAVHAATGSAGSAPPAKPVQRRGKSGSYNAEAIAKSLLSKRANMEDLSRALSEVLSNVYSQLEQALREKSEAEIAKQIAESKLENILHGLQGPE